MSSSLGIVRSEAKERRPAPLAISVPTASVQMPPCEAPLGVVVVTHHVLRRRVGNVLWLLGFLLAILQFSMPVETLEAISAFDVSAAAGEDAIAADHARFFMRTSSVYVLIATSGLPCAWCWYSRILAFVSLGLATGYWSYLVVDDEHLDMWYGATFLTLALALPLMFTLADAVAQTRAAWAKG